MPKRSALTKCEFLLALPADRAYVTRVKRARWGFA
jgi:hypothetical protein